MSEDKSSPFSHLHKGLDHLSKPANDLEHMDLLGWGYDKEKLEPKKAEQNSNPGLDQEELMTLSFLSEQDRIDLAMENTIARAAFDLPALVFDANYAMGSIGIKGRGRESIHKIMAGTAPKISVPTTMQKVRRIFKGGGNKKEEVGTEEEWTADS